MIKYIWSFLLVFSSCLWSQNKSNDTTKNVNKDFLLSGYIMLDDSVKTSYVSYAKIYNTRTGYYRIAEENGFYFLSVEVGDTLEISSVGYETSLIIIDKSLYETAKTTKLYSLPHTSENIYLPASVTDLQDFMIYSITREEFKHQMVYMRLDTLRMPDLNIPNNTAPASGGVGIGISGPLTQLYNRFGKDGRTKHKLNKYRKVILRSGGQITQGKEDDLTE